MTPARTIDYTYTGFVLDDNASDLTKSPSGTVDITETTPVGDYDITIGVVMVSLVRVVILLVVTL